MRMMLMIKGDPAPGAAPSDELLSEMGRFNDELKEAAVLLDLAGLHPSGEGKARRVLRWGAHRHRWAIPRGEGGRSRATGSSRWSRWTRPSNGRSVSHSRRWPRIYPGEYGATGEVEIRQVFEPAG